jgi:hypothetical protein
MQERAAMDALTRWSVGVCVALATATPARAQEIDHALGAELALVTSATRDDLLVPLAHTGGGAALGIGYLGRVGPGLLDLSARMGLGVEADRNDALAAAVEQGLGLRYLFPLRPLGRWRLAVGPSAGLDADVSYFGDWDDAHAYWLAEAWLGGGARAWRPIRDRWRVDLAGELAVVGLQSRPPSYRLNKQDPLDDPSFWLVDVYDDAEPGWIADWQLARVRIDLSRTDETSFVTRSWRVGVELRLSRSSEPETAFAAAAKLVVGKAWGW